MREHTVTIRSHRGERECEVWLTYQRELRRLLVEGDREVEGHVSAIAVFASPTATREFNGLFAVIYVCDEFTDLDWSRVSTDNLFYRAAGYTVARSEEWAQ